MTIDDGKSKSNSVPRVENFLAWPTCNLGANFASPFFFSNQREATNVMEAAAATRKSQRLRRKPTALAADALVSLAASPSRPASAASGALPVSES